MPLCSCSSNFKVNTQACSAFVIVTAAEVSVVAKNELQPHHFFLPIGLWRAKARQLLGASG